MFSVAVDILGEVVIESGSAIRRRLKRRRIKREEDKLWEQGGTADDPNALDITLPEASDDYGDDGDGGNGDGGSGSNDDGPRERTWRDTLDDVFTVAAAILVSVAIRTCGSLLRLYAMCRAHCAGRRFTTQTN